jgi:proteasome alpha subunit
MSYSLYDWNQSLQQRNEYVEDRLKDGSPIVAVSYEDGILMLTLRAAQQRKVFEVYDRLMLGALGKQSDIESLRLSAIDVAHREGFERSPDDVSIQRLVGFSISPAIKRVYNDQSAIPLTLRAVFTEIHKKQEDDALFVLGYDGEFAVKKGAAVAAGTSYAEQQAETSLTEAAPVTLSDALKAALTAWGIGRARLAPEPERRDEDDDYGLDGAPKVTNDPSVALREALKDGATVEAGILSRSTRRESKFRLLEPGEVDPLLSDYR